MNRLAKRGIALESRRDSGPAGSWASRIGGSSHKRSIETEMQAGAYATSLTSIEGNGLGGELRVEQPPSLDRPLEPRPRMPLRSHSPFRWGRTAEATLLEPARQPFERKGRARKCLAGGRGNPARPQSRPADRFSAGNATPAYGCYEESWPNSRAAHWCRTSPPRRRRGRCASGSKEGRAELLIQGRRFKTGESQSGRPADDGFHGNGQHTP